ncbi:hypothetical protein BpJC7_19480 [Weizmannia acidilactici]|uniref:Subtilisin n=1 Tax=Weizmannia acidilactici TaxID=2607726 RepID=A0A5J4JIX1_9BACI|nr:S8 family serine peptidase [Weizmannia acidilactici]GER70645.1 hypothetical protein BpJC7_19480 [Weizmannia acidilactici]GER72805.1 hypothetical protein BpPP18_08720 [Weizmannia acidilactici]
MPVSKYWRKSVLVALSFLLAFPITADQVRAKGKMENVIVTFKEDVHKKAITEVNGKIEQSYEHIPAVSGKVPASRVAELEHNDEVKSVEPDQQAEISGQTVSWGIVKVKASTSWKSGDTGKGVKIAIIDTGIAKHADLSIAGGVSMISSSYNDNNGHGTHVAGIIGAKNNSFGVVGVAPGASLYAVKVLDSKGKGDLEDVIKGIDWSIAHKMNIINLSLGVKDYSPALKQAVDKAYKAGILVVAAAGNNSTSKTKSTTDNIDYPAKYASVIAVGGTDENNDHAPFSSIGKELEVSAPAIDILSTYISKAHPYARMDGTSMAAPFASGALALLIQKYPGKSAAWIRSKLDSSVHDLGPKGRDVYFGYGLVQAPGLAASVSSAKSSFQASLTTDHSTYKKGSSIQITEKVFNQFSKKAIPGATVKLTLKTAKGVVKTVTVKTNTKGTATYKFSTASQSYRGTYTISATVSKSGYYTRTQFKTVKVE